MTIGMLVVVFFAARAASVIDTTRTSGLNRTKLCRKLGKASVVDVSHRIAGISALDDGVGPFHVAELVQRILERLHETAAGGRRTEKPDPHGFRAGCDVAIRDGASVATASVLAIPVRNARRVKLRDSPRPAACARPC
jgi:hypothetical protein